MRRGCTFAGRKVILFTHHLDVLDQVEHALGRKHKHIRITGKTPPKDRQDLCDQFQKDEKVRAALLTINATGVSFSLVSWVVDIIDPKTCRQFRQIWADTRR